MQSLGKKLIQKQVLGKKSQFAQYLGNKKLAHKKHVHYENNNQDDQNKKPISPLEKRSQWDLFIDNFFL